MKKTLSLILFAVVLLACNSSTSDETTTHVNEQDTATTVVAEKEHANDVSLTLNNGAKWNGDESTNANVKNLETILSDFKPSSTPATADYVTLSNNLQSGLDKLVQECRMKGPDHDALHAWLEPLIVKIKNLKQTSDVNAAVSATEDIREHVHLYHDYFE